MIRTTIIFDPLRILSGLDSTLQPCEPLGADRSTGGSETVEEGDSGVVGISYVFLSIAISLQG